MDTTTRTRRRHSGPLHAVSLPTLRDAFPLLSVLPPVRIPMFTRTAIPCPTTGRGRRYCYWIVSPHLLGRSGHLSLVDEPSPHRDLSIV